MLTKKFYAKKAPPPVQLYYNGVARSANAGPVTVEANIDADLVISKRRTGSAGNSIFDRVRGALKRLSSFTTAVEVTDTNSLTGFVSKGFTLGADSTATTNSPLNASIMHWCFREQPGYLSIDQRTGDGEFKQTFTHSLEVPPELVIGKSLDAVQLWPVMAAPLAGKDLVFNTNAQATAPLGNFRAVRTDLINQGTWRDVCFGGGVYVGIQYSTATSNRVLVSTDGETWAEYVIAGMPTSPASTTGLASIAWSPHLQKFVAMGFTASYTSPDGQVWTKGPDYPFTYQGFTVHGLAASDTQLVALTTGNNTANSVDGLNWTLHAGSLSTSQRNITWGAGTFVTIPSSSNTTAHYSDDGITFTPVAVPLSARTWNDVKFGNGAFIGVGTLSAVPPGDVTRVQIRSTNQGRSWSSINLATTQSWFGLAYGDGMWVAGGADTASESDTSRIINVSFDDGLTWSSRSLVNNAYWEYWTYGPSGFVGFSYAVGEQFGALVQLSPGSAYFQNPTSATLDAGALINVLDVDYISYSFASLPGVSKIGKYTGNDVSQTIDCGFVSAPRFVMLKRATGVGDWLVWDSSRGINVSTNDPFIALNQSPGDVLNDNAMAPANNGFRVTQTTVSNVNVLGADYIYLAIA